ncbi:LysM peptidoglycan-binding domain-containing protein [Thiovibrio sp. JS02]
MFVHHCFRLFVPFLLSLATIFYGAPQAVAGSDPFPVYDCIRDNVAFWRDIYARYSNTQGVVHDSRNLGIVYEVIELEGVWEKGARKRDQQRIEQAKEKYARILTTLANSGACPQTREERRVVSLFGPQATPEDFLAARDYLRVQSGQKDLFREGVIRSGSYLGEIKNILGQYGLPEELAYLPHVESSFNYQAYSKFGAAGIWQFMHDTAKQYMTVDYAIDERRDPLLATHAAARMLKRNYERLGSWPLAITAYNHGPNGMMRAKEAHGSYEKIYKEYASKSFGFASRNFYSEFLAAREVAKNYKTHFGSLRLNPPVNSKAVTLPNYAHVNDLVKHLKVDMAAFRALNPALREPVYSGQKLIPKGYQVRVPEQGKVLQMAASIPKTILKEEQTRSSIYMVRRGDTTSSIARQHGLTVQELAQANQLDRRATIYVGQNLRIPRPEARVAQLAGRDRKKSPSSPRLASLKPPAPPVTPKVAAVPEIVAQAGKAAPGKAAAPLAPVVAGPAKVFPPEAAQAPVVASPAGGEGSGGERNGSLAAAPGLSAPEKSAIPAGESLAPPANPAVVLGNFAVEQMGKKNGIVYGIIRVEAEETLGHYAEWLGVRAWDIRRLNGFRYNQDLKINQQLKIPLAKVGKERFEEQRYEYHKEMEEDFFAAYKVEGSREYRVKKGDNIWALCQGEFELPFWLIKKYNNGVDFNQLKLDQPLLVPLVESQS